MRFCVALHGPLVSLFRYSVALDCQGPIEEEEEKRKKKGVGAAHSFVSRDVRMFLCTKHKNHMFEDFQSGVYVCL